jgi:hypothetical protein
LQRALHHSKNNRPFRIDASFAAPNAAEADGDGASRQSGFAPDRRGFFVKIICSLRIGMPDSAESAGARGALGTTQV